MLMNSQARLCINIGTNEREGERHPIGLIEWAPLPHQSSISQMEPTANALATNVLFLSTHHHPQRTNQRDGPTAGVNTQQKTRTYKKTPKSEREIMT